LYLYENTKLKRKEKKERKSLDINTGDGCSNYRILSRVDWIPSVNSNLVYYKEDKLKKEEKSYMT
jgi:hypothetical protein